ncbi:LacI family DNA-binding transcriptional regulator [Novosphingobium lentum]|uniref:LacI family DNA-binding transcriptional regulator n=1 Tax=Novosphingobium lentum TaxID=145287 RepID=UPI000835EF14|nr:LacI family DNA-binding transcriptional regulator [Novosphingobium lentum]
MNLSDPSLPAPGHATMADVARLAGVSNKSVSRVINAEPHVSPKLRQKVEAAIAALNYVPDTAARSLAGSRSFTIGLLFDNPSPNYTMKVMNGAYGACVDNGYHLRIDSIDSTRDSDGVRSQLDGILRHSRSDGFVLTPPLTDNALVLEFLEQRGVPYARIAPVLDPGRSASVQIDDAGAAAAVATMLWDNGHRRFGLINGPAEHGAAGTRRAGFLGKLRELNPEIIVPEAFGGFSFAGGIAGGRDLLSARKHPTAIFAANDDMAAGLIVACSEMGLSVPRDVSVVGFDDSWIAMSVWPYLTTVYQPIDEMAREAATMLIARHRNGPADTQLLLSYRIVERASVGPAR